MSESPKEDIEFCAEVAEDYWKDGFKYGAESRYSEEEVIVLLQKYRFDLTSRTTPILGDTTSEWFEKFKKKV